jgi:hypothetical protein
MSDNNGRWYRFTILASLVALVLLALIFTMRQSSALPGGLSSKWQAVFLTDGQVYFGKLQNYNNSYALLHNVYYLKFAEGLQQEKASSSGSLSSRNLNLIRLGGEAHGPEGDMYIAKDKILFFENLKANSTVVGAIEKSSS